MSDRWLYRASIDVGAFTLAAAGCHVASSLDRPITAVLVFLTGVIAIAVHSGLRGALIAAIGASVTYNFLSGKPYAFTMTSSDELVPLVAFFICAVVTGVIVGRLKDAARRASSAQAETSFLLRVSDRLQRAISVVQVELDMRDILPAQIASEVEIYLARGADFVRATEQADGGQPQPVLLRREDLQADGPGTLLFDLEGTSGNLGIVRFRADDKEEADRDARHAMLRSISALLALAVERCTLLETVAEAQAAQRGELLKDAILSSVSHDLRTPLTAIKAAASALTSSQVSLAAQDREALLHSIVDQCRRLDRYTSELLDVGRIHAGIPSSQFDCIELSETLRFALNHATAAYPKVDIKAAFPPDPVFVMANPVMLEQAIFNVLENACKFGGPHGAIRITLGVEKGRAVVTISDRGPGIASEDLPHLFTRFFRSERAPGRSGSGLGLYITKGFVEAFSGTIAVQPSTPQGTGAMFMMSFPSVSVSPRLKAVV